MNYFLTLGLLILTWQLVFIFSVAITVAVGYFLDWLYENYKEENK